MGGGEFRSSVVPLLGYDQKFHKQTDRTRAALPLARSQGNFLVPFTLHITACPSARQGTTSPYEESEMKG